MCISARQHGGMVSGTYPRPNAQSLLPAEADAEAWARRGHGVGTVGTAGTAGTVNVVAAKVHSKRGEGAAAVAGAHEHVAQNNKHASGRVWNRTKKQHRRGERARLGGSLGPLGRGPTNGAGGQVRVHSRGHTVWGAWRYVCCLRRFREVFEQRLVSWTSSREAHVVGAGTTVRIRRKGKQHARAHAHTVAHQSAKRWRSS